MLDILEFFSKKSVRPYRVNEYRQITSVLSSNLFFVGLLIRIFLIITQSSQVQKKYFIPFISSISINSLIDPWTNFNNLGGDLASFPYGIVMLVVYTPLTKLGEILSIFTGDSIFPYIGLSLTTLLIDLFLLIGISILLRKYSSSLLLKAYWFSPLVLYVNYFHGQLDILPITILIWGLCFLQWKRPIISGIIFGLAISAKSSMLVAIPFVIIYLLRNEKIKNQILYFLIGLFICLSITVIPYLFSEGYRYMVLNTPKQFLIYELSFNFNNNLQFYILPAIYFGFLYLLWNIKSITLDLFLIAIGIGFLSIILFIPASPGWYFWIMPFLAFYQIKTNRIHIPLILPFYAFYLIYSLSYFDNIQIINIQALEQINLNKSVLISFIFSLFQTFSILICISMYLYGIKRNNYYKASQKPNIIGLSFNKNNYIVSTLLSSIKNMLGESSISILMAEDYKTKNFNYLANSKFAKKNSMYDYSLLINDLNKLSEGKKIIKKQFKKYDNSNISSSNNILLVGNSIFDLSYIRKFLDFKIAVITDEALTSFLENNQKKEINNNAIISKKENIKNYELFSDLLFIISPVSKSFQISKDVFPKIKLSVKMRNSHICNNLVKRLISITDIHIEFDYYEKDNDFVKINLEGECTGDDIFEIANILIPNLEDLIYSNNCFYDNFQGLMQLIILLYFSELIHLRKLNKLNV